LLFSSSKNSIFIILQSANCTWTNIVNNIILNMVSPFHAILLWCLSTKLHCTQDNCLTVNRWKIPLFNYLSWTMMPIIIVVMLKWLQSRLSRVFQLWFSQFHILNRMFHISSSFLPYRLISFRTINQTLPFSLTTSLSFHKHFSKMDMSFNNINTCSHSLICINLRKFISSSNSN